MAGRRLDTDGIPLDPDADASRGAARRLVADVGVVFVGGAAGTALRYLVELVAPAPGGLPLGTLAVNVVGAFVLGLLLEALALRGPDVGLRRRLRLGLGTGVLGGFTTYSAFALESTTLVGDGAVGLALAYAVGSVLLGIAAAAGGVLVAGGARRERTPA